MLSNNGLRRSTLFFNAAAVDVQTCIFPWVIFFFQSSKWLLIMNLKPVRGNGDNIYKMHSHTLCECSFILAFVNSHIVAYHEAVNKTLTDPPPLCKPDDNIPEHGSVEKPLITGKAKPVRFYSIAFLHGFFLVLRQYFEFSNFFDNIFILKMKIWHVAVPLGIENRI